jgi:hypothetical protein
MTIHFCGHTSANAIAHVYSKQTANVVGLYNCWKNGTSSSVVRQLGAILPFSSRKDFFFFPPTVIISSSPLRKIFFLFLSSCEGEKCKIEKKLNLEGKMCEC